jgi:hypothetical protein
LRVSIAIVVVFALLAAQLAGAVCTCTHEEGRTEADEHEDHDHGAVESGEAMSHDADEPVHHHHDHGPAGCECSPSQPLAEPDTSSVLVDGRLVAVFIPPLDAVVVPVFLTTPSARIPRPARPPPLIRGVCSASPASLPVLLN